MDARSLQTLRNAIESEFVRHPPRIGVVGVSGTGKSSTINALFRTDLPISHTIACTKTFRDVVLEAERQTHGSSGARFRLHVVDAPGLGEDLSRDPHYLATYERALVDCDVILWIMTARNRAIALDQLYLERLAGHHRKCVFGINQVDLVEPLDWRQHVGLPSRHQLQHIAEIVSDRQMRLRSTLGRDVTCVPYSAQRKYNLQDLFTSALEAMPEDRAWIFSMIKGFRPEDFLPAEMRDRIAREADRRSH